MRYSNLLVPLLVLAAGVAANSQAPTYGLGRTPSDQEIQKWDITIAPDGKGLPHGSGNAKDGAKVYAQRCAWCHGEDATGEATQPKDRRRAPALVGGKGTLTSSKPLRTIENFYPHATIIWDYINRAMPLLSEGSLSVNEVYAVTAFLLYRSGIIKEDAVMDAETLPKVQMPNRDGFVPQRAEWKKGAPLPFGIYPP
jgi:mono/diheme cytochrome c family protein